MSNRNLYSSILSKQSWWTYTKLIYLWVYLWDAWMIYLSVRGSCYWYKLRNSKTALWTSLEGVLSGWFYNESEYHGVSIGACHAWSLNPLHRWQHGWVTEWPNLFYKISVLHFEGIFFLFLTFIQCGVILSRGLHRFEFSVFFIYLKIKNRVKWLLLSTQWTTQFVL